MKLVSPTNGAPLRRVSEYLLDDGERLWPVVDGIPYLRPKTSVREAAVGAIQRDATHEALLILLADQDDFSPTAPPDRASLTELLNTPELTLRRAMELLNYGPVSDYFAYRWCSPTFLSGLRLLELSVRPGQPVVEYACGIGHFLRELELVGVATVGVDIVYSKLWLARRLMDVHGQLICGDIEQSTVVEPGCAGAVFCHDAFYFFAAKQTALDHMRLVTGAEGSVVIGHVHTDRDAHRAGHSLALTDYRALTNATIRDDRRLANDYSSGGNPLISEATAEAPAVAWIEGPTREARKLFGYRAGMQLNPLIGEGRVEWPSQGWREEYERDARGLEATLPDLIATPGMRTLYRKAANGNEPTEGLALQDKHTLARNTVLLNLPDKW